MRIRKNARISSLSLANTSTSPVFAPPIRETQVCKLNRSPWDVIPFLPQSDFFFSDHAQVEIEENINGCSFEEGIGNASKSIVYSKKLGKVEVKKEEEEQEEMITSSSLGIKERKRRVVAKEYGLCNKSDGKGWQCKKLAQEGHSLCEYHLNKLRASNSYNHANRPCRKLSTSKTAVASRGGRKRKSRTSASPVDFYYYSGFGPLWGRKRATGVESDHKKEDKEEVGDDAVIVTQADDAIVVTQEHSSHSHGHGDLHYDDENDDDDDDDGKKRIRKPIKARLLKSFF